MIFSKELEKHDTRDIMDGHKNGELTVIYRNYDKVIKKQPKMIYSNKIMPGEVKGPHIHKKRTSYFVCIQGKVIFVIKEKNGEYVEIESSEEKPVLVKISNGIASAHINPTNKTGRIIALADIAWKPNDNEMINAEFENYDWSKWKNNLKYLK